MRLVIITALLGVAAACAPARAEGPNVVLIMVDDMAYHELGVTGQLDRANAGLPAIETPNLDSLAQQGLLLENFYATPICAPSRGSLLTGLHSGHASIDRNGGNNGGNPLRDVDYTIAQHLQAAGYTTGVYGKWGVGGHATNSNAGNINTATITHPLATPTAKGFDEAFGYLHQVHAHDYYVEYLWEHDTDNSGDVGGMQTVAVSESDYSHDLIADKSLDFITNHADPTGANPFFLYAPYTIPHGEYNPPDDAIRQAFIAAGYTGAQADYAAMMKRLDNTIGDVVGRLQDPDGDGDQADSVYDDTLIMFFSDNGGNANKNALFNGGGVLRGNKGGVFEGSIKSPFIAHWNGTIAPGQVNDTDIAGLDDMFATLADLAGTDRPIGLDGVSIAGLFNGGAAEKRAHRVFEGNGSAWSIRMGDWKLVNGSQLYHLPTDPSESNDVSGANPAIANLMAEIGVDEGVLSDAGNDPSQTTHIVQYKSWSPQPGSTDWGLNANWAGGTEFNTRGVAANNFDTPPADNWIATVDNTSGVAADVVVGAPSEVLALELRGSTAPLTVTVEPGASLMARNGAVVGAGATLDLRGGRLHTMRAIHVEPGGTLQGAGDVTTSYDTAGTPFELKADVVNEGLVDVRPAAGGFVAVELVQNGGFENGVQSDSDPDYRFTELDNWTSDGVLTRDAAKPDNAAAGVFRGLIASRADGPHNTLQNTGHTIALGDELTLSFAHRGFLGWDAGVDEIEATVFYLDDAQTRQVLQTVVVAPALGAWNTLTTTLSPINEPGAAGRELWLEFDTVSGNTVTDSEFASLDEVSLTTTALAPPTPAVLAIDGDYRQGDAGVLRIDLAGGGGQAGGDFDQVVVSGVAVLAGQLELRVESGYQPAIGDSFQVLSAGVVEGVFDGVVAPSVGGGLALVINYSATGVHVAVGGVPGDYNLDGFVDAADYALWRESEGQSGAGLAADGDFNGVVDALDFQVWQANRGAVAFDPFGPAASTVPEASGAVMAALPLGAASLRASRRHAESRRRAAD